MDDFITQDMIDDFAEKIRKHVESILDYLKQKAQELAQMVDNSTVSEAQIINKVFESLEDPKILSILDLTGVEVTPVFQFSVD